MNTFHIFLSSVRWQDLLDIALNSYFIFRMYVLFRGTTAFRVLIGIVLLWFVQRIAVSLGFIVTSWAVQGITAVAALIIIVVFRNEIRAVLQAKNLRTLLWGLPKSTAPSPIEMIADSVYELASKRIGALMVLPGKEDFKETVHSGIPWKGNVSKEMILSIFWPDNPVHDGAVIIRGNQVEEVGVILPLSHRQDLPSSYGTRHRAAAGLAEVTDALTIAVSEERGSVTLAKGTNIREVASREELLLALAGHVGSGDTRRRPVAREKIRLAVAGLASVFLVAGIWFSFTRGLDTLVTLEVPVEYMNRDPGVEILDTSVNSVFLNLIGSGPLMKALRPGTLKVRLDLRSATVGVNTFTLTQENVSLPPGVVLKDIEPAIVKVTLDIPIKQELPVQVQWVGKLPDTLIMTEARLDPQTVQVIGSARILERISTIYTENVALEGLDKSGAISVRLVLNPASLRIAPESRDRVTIYYALKERPKEEPSGS
jgi:uncharacterized protein (TIGR00159 family)